jgi:hypothetical protein
MKNFPTQPVEIELAGKTRQLRYSLAAVRRIKTQYNFSDFNELCKLKVEDYLPSALMEGVIDKEGLTVPAIEESLTGPDMDYSFTKFCTAFFGERVAQFLAVVEKNQDKLLEKIDAASEPAKTEATIVPTLLQ